MHLDTIMQLKKGERGKITTNFDAAWIFFYFLLYFSSFASVPLLLSYTIQRMNYDYTEFFY